MSDITKFKGDLKFVDDLKEPTLGRIIGDETGLMFTWATLAIGAVFYLPGLGFISALGIAYLGYRDVKATLAGPSASQGQHQSPSLVGPATKLNAVEAPAYALPSGPTKEGQQSEPEPEFVQSPWESMGARPPTNSYPGDVYATPEEKAIETQASPVAIAEFRAPNVDDLLKLPIKKRAEEMLAQLKLSGCNLRPYIYDKVIIATGTQRSGKSTIIVLIGILEAALLGKKLRYITSDGDIYPVAFDGLANGSEFYGKATEEIKNTQPGQASDIVWIFDEVTKQATPVKEALWEQLLTGFVKTGASARLITHGTTMKAIGFPAGMAEQVKTEAVIVKALRKSDVVGREAAASLPNGGQYPSGEYRRQELAKDGLADVKGETLNLPDWLLFATNSEGNPCYVRTLLKYFPELNARASGVTPPGLFPEPVDEYEQARQSFEATLDVDATHPALSESVVDDQGLNANAIQFAQVVFAHLDAKGLSVVSLARLLADNYQAKQAFKGNSSDPGIREKGKETAKQLALRCRAMGALKVDVRGEFSINLSRPEAPLFS